MVRWDITATKNMNKTNLFKALLLALVGGTIAFTACSPGNEPEPQPEPQHNVELFFNRMNTKQIDLDTIQKYVANQHVDTIFMIPDDEAGIGGGFSGYPSSSLPQVRDYLEQRISVSRKVRGKGDLRFAVGKALPADSLWFVEQGWTVNQSRKW